MSPNFSSISGTGHPLIMAGLPATHAPYLLPVQLLVLSQLTRHVPRCRHAGPSDVTDFTLQAAVPKFMQIRLEPASSSTLPAMGLSSATQRIVVSNTMHGQKALVMRLRISYTADGQPALEQAEVGNFPLGL